MLRRIEAAIKSFPKAAMFGLAEEGYTSVFEQLVSCVISIRGMDEVTYPISRALFAQARTPPEIINLGERKIESLLHGTSFAGQKAGTIIRVAEKAQEFPSAQLPADFEILTSIKGIGPKCANLALGVAGGRQLISVDIHVHRVVNRWGLVQARSAEATMNALEQVVPERYWTDINRLLMPFGKHICTLRLPACSTCPIAKWCLRIGVTKSQ